MAAVVNKHPVTRDKKTGYRINTLAIKVGID